MRTSVIVTSGIVTALHRAGRQLLELLIVKQERK